MVGDRVCEGVVVLLASTVDSVGELSWVAKPSSVVMDAVARVVTSLVTESFRASR
jgi:hypothetical protein